MEWAKEFLDAYRYFIYLSLLLLLSVLILIKWWNRIKFWWMCTWMKFPLIGKISKLSKDIETMDDKNWFYSEASICGDFYSYYSKYNKDAKLYENSKSYLSKADELGRKPFPIYMWFVVGTLVILEALGFGYVLAGWTIPGASESLQQQGALGIALIISIILVGFTHWSGHEIYHNSLIKKIRIWFINNRNDNKPNLERDSAVSLEHDYKDDGQPNYLQLLNRVKANATVTPSWIITIITAILIISIAIGATYVRGQVLEKQLTAEVNNKQTNIFSPLPTELTKNQQEADDKALKDSQDSDRKGGWATFIVLAVIFVFIQLLGIMFGYRFGFAGRESEDAYKNCFSFASKQEFINYYKNEKERIAKIAQQNLQTLQQRMAQKSIAIGTSAKQSEIIKKRENRTFLSYVQIKNEESLQYDIADNSMKKRSKMIEEEETIQETPIPHISCSNCGHSLEKNEKFCSNCGTPSHKDTKPTCPLCGTVYSEGTKFCAQDGNPLELR